MALLEAWVAMHNGWVGAQERQPCMIAGLSGIMRWGLRVYKTAALRGRGGHADQLTQR